MSGGKGKDDWTASNQLADIVSNQWTNFKALYTKPQDQLIKDATSPGFVADAQSDAQKFATQASTSSEAGLQRDQSRMGLSLTPMQQQALSRQQAQQRGLAQAGAANMAGRQAVDTQTQILSGSSPNITGLTKEVSQSI